MCELTISIPDERLAALHVPRDQAASELQMLAAVQLYQMGRLSTGAAVEFAGISKPLLLSRFLNIPQALLGYWFE